jgi:hypothetical protein
MAKRRSLCLLIPSSEIEACCREPGRLAVVESDSRAARCSPT